MQLRCDSVLTWVPGGVSHVVHDVTGHFSSCSFQNKPEIYLNIFKRSPGNDFRNKIFPLFSPHQAAQDCSYGSTGQMWKSEAALWMHRWDHNISLWGEGELHPLFFPTNQTLLHPIPFIKVKKKKKGKIFSIHYILSLSCLSRSPHRE